MRKVIFHLTFLFYSCYNGISYFDHLARFWCRQPKQTDFLSSKISNVKKIHTHTEH